MWLLWLVSKQYAVTLLKAKYRSCPGETGTKTQLFLYPICPVLATRLKSYTPSSVGIRFI